MRLQNVCASSKCVCRSPRQGVVVSDGPWHGRRRGMNRERAMSMLLLEEKFRETQVETAQRQAARSFIWVVYTVKELQRGHSRNSRRKTEPAAASATTAPKQGVLSRSQIRDAARSTGLIGWQRVVRRTPAEPHACNAPGGGRDRPVHLLRTAAFSFPTQPPAPRTGGRPPNLSLNLRPQTEDPRPIF